MLYYYGSCMYFIILSQGAQKYFLPIVSREIFFEMNTFNRWDNEDM
jgi:hypothetical protein